MANSNLVLARSENIMTVSAESRNRFCVMIEQSPPYWNWREQLTTEAGPGYLGSGNRGPNSESIGMCGRYTLAAQLDLITDRFLLKRVDVKQAFRYNIAPTQLAPVIRQTDSGRTLSMMRWGLVPFWAKDESIGNKLINARGETLAEKPSFKRSLERKRCIVPADGFYEWKKSKDGKSKRPMRIVVGQGDLFGFAGLWDRWKSPDGQVIESFTIITTEPNKTVSPIHDRMPVILTRESEDHWIDPEIIKPELLTPLLMPYQGEMRGYEVSTAVNSPSNDFPSLIEPVSPELL